MGQTLTHGIYLPDEGERNCYNGLAGNWQLLDGAVGTIAEHTSALVGKAPLVHTHTKGDITDFPAYGNAAGTICEGNDSRLSDARTPVAHTHTKSDVTDLFNSANVWTGQNTFSDHTYIYGQWKGLYFQNPEATAGVSPSGDKRNYIAFLDSNGYTLGSIVLNVTGANSTWLQTGVSAKDTNDSSQSVYCGTQYRVYGNGEKYFNPSTNGDTYLGASTLQWKSVYAQSYYYNGTAWGLDKANVWSNYNSYSKGIELAGNRYAYILPEFAANYSGISILTNSFGKSVKFGNYTADENSVVSLDTTLGFIEISAGYANNVNTARIQPRNAEVAELGTSANKWTTLNGVNPGALSIPSGVRQSIIEYITDVSLGWSNQVTAVRDGYIVVTINDAAGNSIYLFNNTKQYSNGSYGNGSQGTGRLTCMLPVNEGDVIIIFIKAAALSDVFSAYLYVMNGNVNALPSS